ncbi:MAG: DUF2339 domain-containing protein [Lachnospiraceae bacterium]|nr:DUF2339 domain-containing protein [Lachnospiraceae bacterium]
MYFNYLDEEQNRQRAEQGMQTEQGMSAEQGAPDRMKLLQMRIAQLLQISRDPAFTEYLNYMQNIVSGEEMRVEQMRGDLEKQFQVYQRNMQQMAAQQAAPQPVTAQSMAVPTAQPAEAPMQQATMQSTAVPTAQTAETPMQQATMQSTAVPAAQTAETPVQKPAAQPAPAPRTPRRNAEFAIGGAVLSIVGSVFILTAMVLFGMYFMEGLMKGILLYVACAVIMALAEFVLYKRWPRLGMTISAIGITGLYISTLVNYLVLHNFNEWIGLLIPVVITLFVVALSRKRDAVAYRLIGMFAMNLCLLQVFHEKSSAGGFLPIELAMVTAIWLLANVMCLVVPMKRAYTAVNIVHMAISTLFAIEVYMGGLYISERVPRTFDTVWHHVLFLMAAIVLMQLTFVLQGRWQARKTPEKGLVSNAGILITYSVCAFIYMVLLGFLAEYQVPFLREMEGQYWMYRLFLSALVTLSCFIPFVGLRTREEKWFAQYFWYLSLLAIHLNFEKPLEMYLCVLVLLVISKLLSFKSNLLLRISDVAITTLACGMVLLQYRNTYTIPLFIGILLSVLCINYWKTYYEALLTATVAFYTAWHMLPMLKLPVFVGIVFVAVLIFNNVRRWNGQGILLFNIGSMISCAICYLMLVNPVYRNAYLTYLCMLIFGIAIIVICLQKQYQMDFAGKHLVMAVFLTYMALVVQTNYAIVNSILLMAIALGCVGIGFGIRKKSLRVYGLALSLVVCAKLVLYDFGGANTLQKTILFFVVGLIALAIAAIYMVLEKQLDKNQAKVQGEEQL